jgi:hypothetical protein
MLNFYICGGKSNSDSVEAKFHADSKNPTFTGEYPVHKKLLRIYKTLVGISVNLDTNWRLRYLAVLMVENSQIWQGKKMTRDGKDY